MAWRDLDIWVDRTRVTASSFAAIGACLVEALAPSEVHFHDYERSPVENVSRGLYLRVHVGQPLEEGWRIDVWAFRPEELKAFEAGAERLRSRLTDDARAAAIIVKRALWRDRRYGADFGSSDVYRAVLDANVRTVDDFETWLRAGAG